MRMLRATALRALWGMAAVCLSCAAHADDDAFPAHVAPAPSHSAAPAASASRPPVAAVVPGRAPPQADPTIVPYKVQPGDILTVSVWKEQDLQSDVNVRPDGGLSFPLAGDIQASGHSVEEVRAMIDKRLRRVISDPEVTVAVKQINGNRVYVVGKVNKPGDFPLNGPMDVMQALALAGGATPFAELNDIRVIRHENNVESAIRFRYHDVENGRRLEQNVQLHNGDTVVVP